VKKIIEREPLKIMELICDQYCRWPRECTAQEMVEDHCESCQVERAILGLGEIGDEKAPVVDAVEVKHGRWIMRGGLFRCSECDARALWSKSGGTGVYLVEYEQVKTKQCPCCMAIMEEE